MGFIFFGLVFGRHGDDSFWRVVEARQMTPPQIVLAIVGAAFVVLALVARLRGTAKPTMGSAPFVVANDGKIPAGELIRVNELRAELGFGPLDENGLLVFKRIPNARPAGKDSTRRPHRAKGITRPLKRTQK